MTDSKQFNNARELSEHLGNLHVERTNTKQKNRRRSLSWTEKQMIFSKTDGHCHICGGAIEQDQPWEVDHVFAHIRGGAHSVDNYLPAHSTCNKYRWFYSPEEFQWILKLGVWVKTRIEKKSKLALELAEGFVKHEHIRKSRMKK